MTDSEKDEDMKKMGLTEKEKTMRRAKTGSSDDGGGLPTAAYRWRDTAGVNQVSINNPENEWCDYHNEHHRKDELVRRSDVKALIENEGRTLYECNMCGYISSDVQEVADCCDADAIYYDFIRKIDLVQKVEGEASE